MNNNWFDVDTYYFSHPGVKINKAVEHALMFNRVKEQIMYGVEDIIEEEFGYPRTAEELLEAGQGAREWGLDYPIEFFEPVITQCKGYLPIEIKGFVSGQYVPKNTPFLSVKNTKIGMGPLAPWGEAMLMMGAFPTACVSRAYEMAQYLKQRNLPIQRIHGFDLRSYRTKAEAKIGGTAWFVGGLRSTDNFLVAQWIRVKGAGSIPAMAHTLVQNFGMGNELESYKKFISDQKTKGYKMVAVVVDTYSTDNFIKKYLDLLMEITNEEGMTIVYRPDSGDVIDFAKRIYYQAKKRDRLNCTKVIIGENVTFERIKQWDKEFELIGIPLDFFAFGIGGGYHRDLNRDTHGWAMKTCYVSNWTGDNGLPEQIPVMKFADTPLKMSIPGPIDVVKTDEGLMVALESEKLGESAYTTLYRFNETFTEPYMYKPDLENVMNTVEEQDTTQKEILYSSGVLELKQQLIDEWKSTIG